MKLQNLRALILLACQFLFPDLLILLKLTDGLISFCAGLLQSACQVSNLLMQLGDNGLFLTGLILEGHNGCSGVGMLLLTHLHSLHLG